MPPKPKGLMSCKPKADPKPKQAPLSREEQEAELLLPSDQRLRAWLKLVIESTVIQQKDMAKMIGEPQPYISMFMNDRFYPRSGPALTRVRLNVFSFLVNQSNVKEDGSSSATPALDALLEAADTVEQAPARLPEERAFGHAALPEGWEVLHFETATGVHCAACALQFTPRAAAALGPRPAATRCKPPRAPA